MPRLKFAGEAVVILASHTEIYDVLFNHYPQLRIMKKTLATTCLLIVFIANPYILAAEKDDVVATLGSVDLKSSQVKSLLDNLDVETRKRLRENPVAMNQLIRNEIIRQSLLKEAVGKQWDKRPEVKSKAERAREQIVITAYLNDLARPAADYPSEAEIKQVYEANKTLFTIPTQYHIAQIFLSSPTSAKEGQEANAKKANELADKANKSDFAALAKQYSDHKESAAQGGDLGWLPETQVIPELREQIAKLRVGEISKPIRSSSGWHIVKLLEIKPPALQTLGDVREIISSNLRLAQAQKNEREHLESMLQSQKLIINDSGIKALIQ